MKVQLTALMVLLSLPLIAQHYKTGSKLSQEEAKQALAVHNAARKAVGTPPLAWSDQLSRYAQRWAEYLAKNGCYIKHRSGKFRQESYGENIFQGSRIFTVKDACHSWYREIDQYVHAPVAETQSGPVTGHYTQMVWHNTTHLGLGKAYCPSGSIIVVANYSPPGNWVGRKAY